jgi:hypothetical protein
MTRLSLTAHRVTKENPAGTPIWCRGACMGCHGPYIGLASADRSGTKWRRHRLVQDRHLLSLRQIMGLQACFEFAAGWACSAFAVVATEDSVHPSKIGLIQFYGTKIWLQLTWGTSCSSGASWTIFPTGYKRWNQTGGQRNDAVCCCSGPG